MLITDHLRNPRSESPENVRHPVRPSEPRVLIADDQPDVLEALRLLLKAEGFQLETASSPAGVLAAVEAREFDVALIDLNYARDTTSGEEGLNLLSRIQGIDPTLPVVVMTAWGSVEVAVEAMRRGARDFVQKPWDNARLLAIIRTQIELSQALRKGQRLEAENSLLRGEGMPKLIAESSAMQNVLQVISRVGPSDANVLILGENGTGKGVVARALHAVSSRASRPMVIVNSGGVSEGVFESELFGHVRGAFTDAKSDRVGRFELADQGTLFLDEIANVPMSQQAKLLRVIETGEFERLGSSRTRRVDTRIISATNANLAEEVTAGRFRQDLLFRLNTIEIRLPSLARSPRGSAAARAALPPAARAALSQAAHRIRERRDADPARAPVARQRPRTRSRDRARRADGPGPLVKPSDLGLRAGTRRRRTARGHEPRGRRVLPDQEGDDALRRQRQPGRKGARLEPQRPVSTPAALRLVRKVEGKR